MNKNFLKIVTAFTLIGFSACKKSDPTPAPTPTPTPVVIPAINVYACGTEKSTNGLSDKAKYWKNGVETTLNASNSAEAYDIVVSGTDVYIAGSETSGPTTSNAKYWKNGVGTVLPGAADNGEAKKIVVNGNDVHVIGNQFGITDFPRYWKNGVAVSLTYTGSLVSANGLFVNGTDVYISGYEEQTSGIIRALYWKNGVRNYLTSASSTSSEEATDIFVVGADVYACGTEYLPNGTTKAKIWKNGIVTYITTGAGVNSAAFSIKVVGTDVYVGGYDELGGLLLAKYWKNNTSATVGVLPNESFVTDIFIFGTDVYTAGNSRATSSSINSEGIVWKNTTPTSYSNGTLRNLFVNSVFVSN